VTAPRSPRPHSLLKRLFIAQIAPLSLVAVVLLVAGSWTAHRVVERTSDRLLAGATQAILETVSVSDAQVTVDVSPWSLALLDSPERDAVFYSVREGDRLITGYDELPILSATGVDQPSFANLTVRGLPVRMAQQSVEIPGQPSPVIVSVAQSLDSRQASVRELNLSLLLLPGLLVVLAALLIWPAIQWGLYSLKRLTRELASRSQAGATDFAPAPINLAPRELASALSAFNTLLASLERSTSGMQRFSADASHQLRTPLTVVAANLDLLAGSRRPWSKADRRLLSDSKEAIAAMSRLINQLLSTARADSAPGLNQADIGRAVRIAVESLRSSLPCDAVRMRLPEGVVAVQGDENLIVEQMINLLDNASRYGAPPLIVHVARREGQVRITVWDHGPGVDDAELPRLPERFFRSRTAPRATGSGLGLSIVASMAKAQGAEFRLANRARRPGLVATLTYRSA
jgi:two-component system sensor histidine kinase TctE